ncbi:DUF1049 domain-containing protein [Microvirga tunisiensis]|uniref:DUF1049 domain-containing protein n=2 Tax=Pannonibacter tanglangensis TaxID=2750084 RepID=A0A7X5JAB6_9HYPH|nr:DUF1049 domain-containing protein [Pannonibacter sp. XCT-34]NBN80357.1 DUF1049 domain-containing protein [Pannonibacter sp. XCT-53]
MTRFLKNTVLFLIALVLLPLSVANRHGVDIALNPFDPQDPRLTLTDVPLFWVMFCAILVGIVIGGLGAWARQGKWRREARVKRNEADKWHREADQLRAAAADQAATASAALPAPGKDSRAA